MNLSRTLRVITFSLISFSVIGGSAQAQPFSNGTFDPGAVDAGIPGFVGPDGLGIISSNNQVNPLFTDWASGFQNYLPSSEITPQFGIPEQALGPVTGSFDSIVSLGELTVEQIASGTSPGEITLTFGNPIKDGPGADFAVFENGFGFADTGLLFAELAYVEVSTDGINFLRFPSISLTPNPLDPFGQIDPTQVNNLAGKHVNNGVVLADGFSFQSWGTPFDLDVLTGLPDVQAGLVNLHEINFVRILDIPGNGGFADSNGNPIFDPFQTPIPGSGGFDLEAVGVINAASVPESSHILSLLFLGLSGVVFSTSSRQK
ncbi:MAG: PEP-CTERM sorting domain-containing protein [Cyanobacteria bacterium P01_H01_bin.15]